MNDKDFEKVNRLIIIGNGFDLAHGLKTSFQDFIYSYFQNLIYNLYNENRFLDELISISSERSLHLEKHQIEVLTPQQSFLHFKKIENDKTFKIIYTSALFKHIQSNLESKKWVDIELIYYALLKMFFRSDTKTSIIKLNSDLEIIKSKLIDYLGKEQEKYSENADKVLLSQFMEQIDVKEVKSNTLKSNTPPSNYCILNFNYTEVAKWYLRGLWYPNKLYIPIHGELRGDDRDTQKPVFGFGDELDPNYKQFEDQNNDELLKHIKSFKYLQFGHYKALLDFVESRPYQIHIYGHSCGLSDRTLLNTIFEHENCISIKPFFYQNNGNDDYEEKSYAIARNFKSKAELRARVVNKQYCSAMMQPKPTNQKNAQ
ncbi:MULTISPECIES: AbiH family protein [unclassified Paraflavitalea]|uniref:AbiH family protein n=1 Tax=unclassified Paraflavitalea TaxID=2798305 RepID=UPI003D346838